MKSRVIETSKSEYPKLMVVVNKGDNFGMVVLFKHPGSGTVVHSTGGHERGYVSQAWHMDNFEDFYGEVILSND